MHVVNITVTQPNIPRNSKQLLAAFLAVFSVFQTTHRSYQRISCITKTWAAIFCTFFTVGAMSWADNPRPAEGITDNGDYIREVGLIQP